MSLIYTNLVLKIKINYEFNGIDTYLATGQNQNEPFQSKFFYKQN